VLVVSPACCCSLRLACKLPVQVRFKGFEGW
jgi:hypothetical protein